MKFAQPKSSSVDTEAVTTAQPLDETSEENLRERRYLWTARAAAVVAIGSFCTNIILLIALSHLAPLVRTNPFFLTFQSKDAQVVTIDTPKVSESVLPLITENMIRQYLVVRNSIPANIDDLQALWSAEGPVRWMSSNPVFAEFREKAQTTLERVSTERLTRQVAIASVLKTASGNRGEELWEARMTVTEMTEDSPQPKEKHYTVRLQIAYQSQKTSWETRLKNPLGFKVITYNETSQDAIF